MDHRRVKGPPDRQTDRVRPDGQGLADIQRNRSKHAHDAARVPFYLPPSLTLNLNQITFLTLTFWAERASGGNHDEPDRQAVRGCQCTWRKTWA